MAKEIVLTTDAPAPAHVFSQGVKKGGLFQVSGQGPMDPVSNTYIGMATVRVQTRQTLENVKAILLAGGSSVEDVIMFRVYLTKRGLPRDERGVRRPVQENVWAANCSGPHHRLRRPTHEVMLVEIDALAVTD